MKKLPTWIKSVAFAFVKTLQESIKELEEALGLFAKEGEFGGWLESDAGRGETEDGHEEDGKKQGHD